MARTSRAVAVVSTMTGVAAGGLVWASAASALLPPECVQAGPTTVVCTYTSGTNAFTVPAGVTSLHVVAIGGAGATSAAHDGLPAAPGGHGARVEGDVPAQPGTVLFAVVGGNGVSTYGSTSSAANGGANGGGTGACSGGGGASDVRSGAALSSRVLVAAGGGGAGCSIIPDDVGGAGGSWAVGGGDGTGSDLYGHGGQPGTSSLGGAGGAGGVGGFESDQQGPPGQDGSFGLGGSGGASFVGGGGGGGGWTGGGGGGSGAYNTTYGYGGGGGGGGGGWNLVPPGGSAFSDTTAAPKIVLSYSTASSGGGQSGTPVFSATPSSVNFPNQLLKRTTSSVEVTVRNNGDGPLSISSTSLAGTYPGDYIITANNCGSAIAPGANCKVSVAFRPVARGLRPALLRFTDNAAGSPHDVALSGKGCGAIIGKACI